MTGTPWYHLMCNPIYSSEFCYLGPNVAEREKLIEDGSVAQTYVVKTKSGKEVKEMTEESKKERYEQSD